MKVNVVVFLMLIISINSNSQSVFTEGAVNNSQNNRVGEKNQTALPVSNRYEPTVCKKGNYILNEGFENTKFPPAGWSVINGDNVDTWVRNTEHPVHTGQASAAMIYDYVDLNDDYLVTPKMTITGNSIIRLWARDLYYESNFDIKVSTTDSLAKSFTKTISSIATSDNWKKYEFVLSDYIGKDIYIAFHATGFNRTIVDDVEIFSQLNDEVGVNSIDINAPFEPGTYTPKATVENFGSLNQDFRVVCKIKKDDIEIYADSVDVVNLQSITSSKVIFKDVVIKNIGSYKFEIYVVNPGDLDVTNDTISEEIVFKNYLWAYAFHYEPLVGSRAVKFALDESEPIIVFLSDVIDKASIIQCGAWAKGKWYGFIGSSKELITINTETGELTTIGKANDIYGMSYDVTTNTMYAVSNTELFTVDLATGNTMPVVSMNVSESTFTTLACDANGNLFSLNLNDSKLYSIDKTTGNATAIGAVGKEPNYAQDMEFDKTTGILYYTYCDLAEVFLCTVNVTTGGLTKIYDFPEQMSGMAIPYSTNIGVNDVAKNLKNISIFPNPARDVVNISADEKVKAIKVTNLLGSIVLYKTLNSNDIQIDIANFENGIYCFSIETTSNTFIRKIIIEK